MFETPILLITFNRPNHTRRVFEEIKKQKPKQLFIFQDGARQNNEADIEKCAAVRAIFTEPLDWDCELKTYYSDKNLGCGQGPATGISWFFEHVEQGIIMEDDCLPHPDFFSYCEELLKRYKEDDKISFVGGSSFQNQKGLYKESYYYSAGPFATWGWATWRRSWCKFDYFLDEISTEQMRNLIHKYFKEGKQRTYWIEIYEMVKENQCKDTCWDYQFYMSCWKDSMLAIAPYTNLITNIGFCDEATHTFGEEHPAANRTTSFIYPLSHPSCIDLNKKADFYVHKNYIAPYEYGLIGLKRIPYRLNKKIKKIFNHKGSWIKKTS